ncbi:hypothetical protein AB6A40_005957 [Gnathostoma spinigerum]|uniref:Death domain-containing protein n=1 Tax=Gnathostoma spinigerum TaxID=75299 RepID=A0ABD6EH59_9BILA
MSGTATTSGTVSDECKSDEQTTQEVKGSFEIKKVGLSGTMSADEDLWILIDGDIRSARLEYRQNDSVIATASANIHGNVVIATLEPFNSIKIHETGQFFLCTDKGEKPLSSTFCPRKSSNENLQVAKYNGELIESRKDENQRCAEGRTDGNFRSRQLSALYAFAMEGDPLHLLKPVVSLFRITDADGSNVLHKAAQNRQNFALKMLLTALHETDYENDIVNARNARGRTPLHCAVLAGDTDCVHYLLGAGAKKNLTDNDGNTIVHSLCDVYNDDIYKEVLECCVHSCADDSNDVNDLLSKKNKDGDTALHIAIRKLKYALVDALLEANAPIDILDSRNETPLTIAVKMNETDTAMALIDCFKRHSDVNKETEEGEPLLSVACGHKNLVLIGALLDAGADTERPGKDGKKPSEITDDEIQKILKGDRVARQAMHIEAVAGPSYVDASGGDAPPITGAVASASPERFFSSDDVSSIDYLTRLRLAQILDVEQKWEKLAELLNCGHMIEFIRVCADEATSSTMIFLDQYEQTPDSSLVSLAACLQRMGEDVAVRLLKG